MGTAFMAGYGYVEFAGPKEALFLAPDIRVGLLLLGPHLHYPAHAHPAEETYHPLTEGGLWRRGQEGWRTVPAGNAIHHPSMMVHETKAAESTLLALYCWRGNTVTEAQLSA
jgi:quercetin dioxygenase-like cupin family protein